MYFKVFSLCIMETGIILTPVRDPKIVLHVPFWWFIPQHWVISDASVDKNSVEDVEEPSLSVPKALFLQLSFLILFAHGILHPGRPLGSVSVLPCAMAWILH